MDEQFKKNVALLRAMKDSYASTINLSVKAIRTYNEIIKSFGRDLDNFIIRDVEFERNSYENGMTGEIQYSDPYVPKEVFFQNIDAALMYIESLLDDNHVSDSNPSELLISNIFNNFSEFANQIKRRHDNRSTIEIADEYDVQDILHAIFKLFFNDVRKEENTPSFAGRSSRIDFVLPDEKIIIEVKHTRDNLQDKQIGDELSKDITHYTTFENYDNFYVFIYDPQRRIENRTGLKKDLETLTFKDKTIKVFISN